ncbi:magnesium/cobalt transporter CorA [Gudongella sp. SC589]|uniref:magnesium/cobalt transporter CorA n=1 Tax=Gudongella sp. SC589 TaxID=3385990 RepID=UPI003904812B
MSRETKNIGKTVNLPPGTLQYTGEGDGKQQLIVTRYTEDSVESKKLESFDEFQTSNDGSTIWLDVIGLKNPDIVRKISDIFNIHPLVQEDILNIAQIPKVEEYEGYLFTVTKNVFFKEDGFLDTEQISILLIENVVITFQEYDTDSFKHIHDRIKDSVSLRKHGALDLYYSFIDSVVDKYFLVLENIGDKIDSVEDELLENPNKDILGSIYHLKRELVYIRNILWPTRNLASSLARGEFAEIDGRMALYFRDIYDHVIQMIDIVETYRDICSGMLDTYLSSVGYKTNEVMKILTIFSTIFIPLTFLAGVYGMNFIYFPELNWKYGYLIFWLISGLITAFMIRFLRKKGWL